MAVELRKENGDVNVQVLYEVIGKYINVVLNDGSRREGFVYTVDPISLHTVLLQPTEENTDKPQFRTIVVSGHSIQSIELNEDQMKLKKCPFDLNDERNNFAYILRPELNNEDYNIKLKKEIKELFTKISGSEPEERGMSILVHNILINPPYDIFSCVELASSGSSFQKQNKDTSESIALTRVKQILSQRDKK
eukprot:TRINITY_DN1936_c0_g1_i1.p1 TRINITY_DN1936_c0_g1~~TRINITY_DN1936_c0_g1_i1.p1  ORF type:complete len:193 (+),score=42.99 TRINITY_DN1936_c0_g1_i1:3-581(+)